MAASTKSRSRVLVCLRLHFENDVPGKQFVVSCFYLELASAKISCDVMTDLVSQPPHSHQVVVGFEDFALLSTSNGEDRVVVGIDVGVGPPITDESSDEV